MANKVNLDSLIQKEDFEIISKDGGFRPAYTLPELGDKKNTFNILRKPIFQRATSDWRPQQVVDIVKNFLDGDLIPAIIIWNSGHYQFVMDGAHRLSALMAWVNDDYGNGAISQKRAGASGIRKVDIAAHDATRALIQEQVGSYSFLLQVSDEDNVGTPLERQRARGMNSRPIEIQHYGGEDRRKAEVSFFRINQGGTPLNPEEKEIIRTRHMPQSIAARAIWRTGKGKQYWSRFEQEKADLIESLANSVHKVLLEPELDLKTIPIDLPLVGAAQGNAAMGVLDRFIHIANDLPERRRSAGEVALLSLDSEENDLTGDRTIAYLKKALRLAETISSKKVFSLGLHPGVYCYSKACKFLPGAFYAEALLIKELANTKNFPWFVAKRGALEEFILTHKDHLTAITHEGGSGMKSARPILNYWLTILSALHSRKDPLKILAGMDEFSHLDTVTKPPTPEGGSRPSKSSTAAMHLRDYIDSARPCPLCKGRIYRDAWTKGHQVDASDKGSGHSNNLIPEHPYCNSAKPKKK